MAKQEAIEKAPEFRLPGATDVVTTQPELPNLDPPSMVLPIPLGPPREDYDAGRIDIRVGIKAARGMRRLRLAMDRQGVQLASGKRADPNSVRDTIEYLLELIHDA